MESFLKPSFNAQLEGKKIIIIGGCKTTTGQQRNTEVIKQANLKANQLRTASAKRGKTPMILCFPLIGSECDPNFSASHERHAIHVDEPLGFGLERDDKIAP